jgi:plasmid stabilization system protein ParE
VDIERLVDFLIDKSPSAASRTRADLVTALASLTEFPHRGRAGPTAGLRELPVKFGRSAYIIQYRVTGDQVLVLHIFDARQGG